MGALTRLAQAFSVRGFSLAQVWTHTHTLNTHTNARSHMHALGVAIGGLILALGVFFSTRTHIDAEQDFQAKLLIHYQQRDALVTPSTSLPPQPPVTSANAGSSVVSN